MIKVESTTNFYTNKDGKLIVKRKFFTWKARLIWYKLKSWIFLKNNPAILLVPIFLLDHNLLFFSIAFLGTVAFDAASSSLGSEVDTITFDHTCTGTDRGLIVTVHTSNSNGVDHDTVTFDSVSMTREATAFYNPNTSHVRASIFSLINPNNGSANSVVIGISGSDINVGGGAISFSGANQTDLVEATSSYNSSGNNTASNSVTTISHNTIVVDAWSTWGTINTWSAYGGQTVNHNLEPPGAHDYVSSRKAQGSPGSVTMSWSGGSGGPNLAGVMAAVKPSDVFIPRSIMY